MPPNNSDVARFERKAQKGRRCPALHPSRARTSADPRFREFFAATIAIQVFDPQHQLTTRFACALLCAPERHGMTEVQEPRRRWSNAPAIFSLCHSERICQSGSDQGISNSFALNSQRCLDFARHDKRGLPSSFELDSSSVIRHLRGCATRGRQI